MADSSTDHNINDIWQDDLLDRQAEAGLLVGYIESLLNRPGWLRHETGYTIAIDGGYGEGKTYFLRRLAQQLKLNHPVAYIDAWADDLADQPLVALMATLKAALSPVLHNPQVGARWSQLAKKSGQVAKIVAIGLAKRGLGLMISHGGAEALSSVLGQTSEEFVNRADEAIEGESNELVETLAKAFKLSGDMEALVSDFHDAKAAMGEMKESLQSVVAGLDKTSLTAPVIIIIDELDRCRPSYAIKVLEEIKHLFDVPGVVFVLGLHGDQLAHSIQGAYGPSFEGKEYLRRFISRRYSLAKPDMEKLIERLTSSSGLSIDNFVTPSSYRRRGTIYRTSLTSMIKLYADIFSLSTRDLFQLVDMMETAVSVAKPYRLIFPYLMPLVIGHMRGMGVGENPNFPGDLDIFLVSSMDNSEMPISDMFNRMKQLSNMSTDNLYKAYNSNISNYTESVIVEALNQKGKTNEYAIPRNYPRLISAVSRFSNE